MLKVSFKKLSYIIPILCLILWWTSDDESEPQRITQYKIHVEPKLVRKSNKNIKKIVKQYDHIIDSILKRNRTLGAAIAIVHNGKVEYVNCHGFKNSKTKESINEHTVFRLASVSKAVSGVLAGMLINENKIGLEDKIIDYLPNFKLKDSTSTQQLNISHILTHTTGLVPHAYDNLVEANVSYKTIIDKLNSVNIYASPGELYAYQNVTFSLLDTISAIATKNNFKNLMESYVFTPFCMQDASVGFESFQNNNNIAFPHQKIANHRFAQLRLNDHYYNTIPAAGVNASLSDMSQFIKAILSSKENYKDLTETVFAPRIITPLRRSYLRYWDNIQSKHYGLGWRIIGYKDRTIAYHGGYVKGYKTEIAICEEENIGIVYLSNSPDRSASVSIPTFLKLYFKNSTAAKAKKKKTNV
jgi:beta-lactamase class C